MKNTVPYDSNGFPLSGKTYFEVSKDVYFKILKALEKDHKKDINQILKPKKTITYLESLTKRDILGVISLFGLNDEFLSAVNDKIDNLRSFFKEYVESLKTSDKMVKYLKDEGIYEKTLTLKKEKSEKTEIIHNKIKKVMGLLLEKYLNIKIE